MTELELARKIGEDDSNAAEAFVREHYPSILRFAMRLGCRREDAEDIAQESFIVARQRIASYKGRSSLRTWLHMIALNEFRQWKRKRGHKSMSLLDADSASVDVGIVAFETGHILLKAMQNLPEKQREAFVLFEIEELSMNEVAQVLRVPNGTAKARVFYARQNLRSQLEGKQVVIKDEVKHSTSNG